MPDLCLLLMAALIIILATALQALLVAAGVLLMDRGERPLR